MNLHLRACARATLCFAAAAAAALHSCALLFGFRSACLLGARRLESIRCFAISRRVFAAAATLPAARSRAPLAQRVRPLALADKTNET